ncbi:MAG: endolytic transglycosylase MltG, partial [Bacteroidales bacterium]|nr:endolytic transglycosylase MltG [Bacteroidales bacterium]
MGKGESNKKRYIKWAITVVLFVSCIVAAVALSSYITLYKKNVPDKFTLYITPQTTYASLIDTLERHLLDIRSFEKSFAKENPNGKMECGRYVFKGQTKNIEMVRAIRNGWQTPYRLTLSGNIRGVEKLSGILGRRLMRDSAEFSNYFNDPQVWEKYNLKKETFISLFIPNTYELYWDCTPEEFTDRMAKEHSRFWTEERLGKAHQLGLSKEEVSTLASIVCEESNYGPELAAIAGVYINRLKRGMKLDADPTVKFALNDP